MLLPNKRIGCHCIEFMKILLPQWPEFEKLTFQNGLKAEWHRTSRIKVSVPVPKTAKDRQQPVRTNPSAPAPKPLKHTLLVDFLIASLLAVPFGVSLLGTAVINPTNVSWLHGDPADVYIAAAMFRQNTRLYWPLSFTPNLGYPLGETVAIIDANPVLAILFWPFSGILPKDFQYFGMYALLSLILQAFVAMLLIRSFMGDRKRIAVVLGASLFLLSPPLIYRASGHFSLASHWIILLGLLFYRRCITGLPFRQKLISAAALSALAASINPYMLAMTLGLVFAALVTDALKRKTIVPGSIILGSSLAAAILCLYSIGFVMGSAGDYAGAGYRLFALDLVSPIDPIWEALVFKKFQVLSFEGYNYLGLGVILLLVAALPYCIEHFNWVKSGWKRYWPLLGVALVYTLLALSTQIHFTSLVIFDLDPKERLTPILGALRGSGRLFWIMFYCVVLISVIATLRFLTYRTACILLAICVVIQYADTSWVRQATTAALSAGLPAFEKLNSPVWDKLGPRYKHLEVLPANQCWSLGIPGPLGPWNWETFGLLAAEHRMSINSYYAPRNRAVSLAYHCGPEIDEMRTKPLASDTAYVVTPGVAALIEAGPSGSGKCQEADKVILCTATAVSGGAPKNAWTVPFDDRAGSGSPGIAKYLFSGFSDYSPGFGTWSDGDGIVAFRLNPEQLRTVSSIKLLLIVLAGEEPGRFEIHHHAGVLKGSYTGWPSTVNGSFEVNLPINRGNAVQAYRIRTLVRHSPDKLIMNSKDTRQFGLGIRAIGLSSCPPSDDLYGDNAKQLPPCAKADEVPKPLAAPQIP